MKPSDINLNGIPPLTGVFERTEAEVMATFMIRALSKLDDTWRPFSMAEIIQSMETDLTARLEPWPSLVRNPFLKPSLERLLAVYTDEQGAEQHFARKLEDGRVEFTEYGLKRLAGSRWNRAQEKTS